ncbi:glucose-6-phosphate isomerase [Acrasis kona]|uniref:Glucose-6-phosphate isomerase n=1 Tax=Acrasis kona TaxID=1008807 RepID=A0AAW2ZLY1_9EUKA
MTKGETESRYLNGHVFHDAKSNFTLNLAGFELLDDINKIKKTHEYSVKKAIAKVVEIESGAIVNTTANKEETEDRAVDHYNLRHPQELVKGKSLDHSLKQWNEVNTFVSKILDGTTLNEDKQKYQDVIFNGIGGSFLGPLMLVIAAHGDNYNLKKGDKKLPLNLHFFSNTDPDSFKVLADKLDLKTSIMVNISKSGGTQETKGNMDTFNALLSKQGIEMGPHNIAVTTSGSGFDKFAKENKFLNIIYMFNETGGRTSIASAVGMVPAAFAKLSFDEFLKGQSYMDELTRKDDLTQNPALLISIAIDILTKRHGRKNMIVLGYSDFLKEFAHYLQQLYMESLGKEYDIDGVPNPEGQTVFGGVGTGEQHAFMQQVQKGIPDCFVRFIHFLKRDHDYDIKEAGSMGRQLLAFVKGTEDALLQNGKPYMTCTFETCNMFNIGMMVALEERIVTFLGAFRNINAYDQPGVQDGKKAATNMNKVSLNIENFIAQKGSKGWQWKGDAAQARKDFELEESTPIWFVDAVLSDLFANVNVDNSYAKLKGKIQIERSFDNSRFIYSIQSSL